MMGGTKAQYDCIKVFSETDHTADLPKIGIPMLVMHSEDDQIVPFADAGPLTAKLAPNATLKVYKDYPHGMPATHAAAVNAELLTFFERAQPATSPSAKQGGNGSDVRATR
jgi:non-heme chloroperoxidase